MPIQLILFFLAGGCAGFLSGLLGVGGGVIVVPMLVGILTYLHVPDAAIMHIAAGTSLAAMIVTAIAAVISHNKRGNIDWPIWCLLVIPAVIGVIVGAWLASQLDTKILSSIFAIVLIIIAIQIFFFSKPKAHLIEPNKIIIILGGIIAGVASGLLGIGGGALLIPLLIYCNMPMTRVSGTSAACILPLSIVGTIVFIITGSLVPSNLPYSSGFIYWPAFLGIAIGSVLLVPLGTWLGAKVNKRVLKRCFAILLVLVAFELLFH